MLFPDREWGTDVCSYPLLFRIIVIVVRKEKEVKAIPIRNEEMELFVCVEQEALLSNNRA